MTKALPLGRGRPGELRRASRSRRGSTARSSGAASALELIGTFFLVWAIVGVAVNPRADAGWAALVIGGTLGFLVDGRSARSPAPASTRRAPSGPALVSGEWGGFDDFVLTYVLAPVIGAVLAALAYFRMVIVPGKKEPGGMEPVGDGPRG